MESRVSGNTANGAISRFGFENSHRLEVIFRAVFGFFGVTLSRLTLWKMIVNLFTLFI